MVYRREPWSPVEQRVREEMFQPTVVDWSRLLVILGTENMRMALMDDEETYVEQFCEDCRDETDHALALGSGAASCLRCGSVTTVRTEEDRIGALIRRVKEEDDSSLGRIREALTSPPMSRQ